MKRISSYELREVLRLHALRLAGDTSGARANLRGADLSDADLRGADLSGAYLRGAYLVGADLSDADLRGADLSGAYLSGADLRGADLRGAYLSGAYLSDADLGGASGNLREIKTAAFEKWCCAWTMSPEGQSILQIGCQRHPLAKWKTADDRWIDKLDRDALAWWKRYGKLIIKLVETSPATPWGKGVKE